MKLFELNDLREVDMKCPKCGAINPDDALYCNKCGAQLKYEVPSFSGFNPQNTLNNPQRTQEISSHLVEAILVTLFCCLPFGIPAIIYASQVDSKKASGDIDGAFIASQQANKWVKIAFFSGLIWVNRSSWNHSRYIKQGL